MKKVLAALLLISAISGTTFGAIVYSGSQNVTVNVGGIPDYETISIAGSGDSWDDFTVFLTFTMSTGLYIDPGSPMGMGTGIPMLVGMGTDVSNLGFGTLIGLGSFPAVMGLGPVPFVLTHGDAGSVLGGEFAADGGYIGLRMFGSSTHYGWLHMSSQSDIGFGTHSATFDGWAYEDVDGLAIKAGDTGLPVVPVPGALALGSLGVGLVAYFRRRRAM